MGRKNRGGKKLQPTFDKTEMEKFDELGSDLLSIRFAFRKTFGLCLHEILSEDADGLLYCVHCKEYAPESFSKYFHLKTKQ